MDPSETGQGPNTASAPPARPPISGPGAAAPLSGPQKAAVIIALLGPENAGPVVEQIEDRHLRSFMSAFENLQLIPRESMLAAVADFITELDTRRGGIRGGPEAARALAEGLFTGERAERLFGAPPPPPPPKTSADAVWSLLQSRKTTDIARYLSGQRSEVVSIILSQLSTDKTGEILADLPEDISLACVTHMSNNNEIDQRTLDAVAELVQTDFLNGAQDDDSAVSVAFVSEVLGILPRNRRDLLLESLEKSDPEQAELIRKGMMTFEDLPQRLPTSAVPIIFRDFDQEKLLVALKAGGEQEPATIDFLFANISQRMAGQYKEQVEEQGAISAKDADGAISSLMSFISKLEKDGRITLIKPVSPAED